jgi:hypothetical protein
MISYLSGYFRENDEEHDVRNQKREAQLEGLSEHIQGDRLASLEVLAELAEIGLQPDGREGQGEEPLAE